MNKNNVLLLSLVFIFLIGTPLVFGASSNILDNVLQPFSGINIGQTYLRYAAFIDAIIYFWFFIVLTKGIFKEKFPTSVATAVGIILGVGMAVFEYTSRFNLGMLAPLAALIFFAVLGVMLYTWIKSLGDNGLLAFSLTFILLFALVSTIAKQLVDWINKVPFLSALLAIALVASIIGLFVGVFRLFGSIKRGDSAQRSIDREEKENIRREKREKNEEDKAIKKAQKAQEKLTELQRDMDRLNTSISNIDKLESKYLNADMIDRSEQIDVINKLMPILRKAYQAQQALTDVYNKLSKPEYEASKEQVLATATELDTLIQQIETMLSKLDNSIRNSDKCDQTLSQLNTEFNNAFTAKAEGDVAKVNEIDTALKAIKAIDEGEYTKVFESVKKAHADADALYSLREEVNNKDKEITILNNKIKTIDDKNLKDIASALTSLNSNVEKDTGFIDNSLNAIINGSIGKDIMNTKRNEGKFAGALEIIRQGHKYFSASSYRQVFEALLGIQKIMRDDLIPAINKRNKLIGEKKTLAGNYTKEMDAKALPDMKAAYNKALEASQNNFRDDQAKVVLSLTKVDNDLIKNALLINKLSKKHDELMNDKSANFTQFLTEIAELKSHIDIAYHVSPVYKFKTNTIATIHKNKITYVYEILENVLNHYTESICNKSATQLSDFAPMVTTVSTETADTLSKLNALGKFP